MVQIRRRALDDLIDECLPQAWPPAPCDPTGTPDIHQHETFAHPLPHVAVAMMAAVGTLAAFLPAWRAARIDPVEVLREG